MIQQKKNIKEERSKKAVQKDSDKLKMLMISIFRS